MIFKQDVKAMQVLVDALVGIPKFSYPARQNAPRPKGQFCSVQLIEQYTVGLPVKARHSDILDADGNVTGGFYRTYASVRLRFRLTMIDSDGIASAQVANGWMNENIKELMKEIGYGFLNVRTISGETAQLEKQWEFRQGFSVELSTTRILEETINDIGSISPINGVYVSGLDKVLLKIEINK